MKVEEDVLERYQDEIRTLKEENELLRMSARFFGALAERLHVRLQDARRQTERGGQPARSPTAGLRAVRGSNGPRRPEMSDCRVLFLRKRPSLSAV